MSTRHTKLQHHFIVAVYSATRQRAMKQRITYISLEYGGVDPSTLEITNDSLDLKDLKAAKEWRITLDPREVLLPEVRIDTFIYQYWTLD